MKHIYTLLITLLTSCNILLYSEELSLNGSYWQKDGRSLSLGGGMNAIEQTAVEGISVNYYIPFQLKELSTRSIKIAHRTRWMNLDGLWAQTGDAVFMENFLALGASRNLSESFLIGVKAGYYHCTTISEKKGFALLSEILCKYRLNEKMQLSIYLFNPTGSKLKQAEDCISINPSFHLGGSFYFTKKAEWLLEIEKTQKKDPIGHLGFEYAAWKTFIIRTGLSTQPLRPSWGIGGQIQHFRYALGGNIHPTLGLSTCFSLYYNW